VQFSERSGEILTDEYFFGSVVLVNGAAQRLLLLDGQQRLATSTILLSAIRDTIFLFNKRTATYIQNNWLSGFDEIKQDEIQKIRLNIYDRDFFKRLVSDPRGENYVEPEPAYASHNLIAAARAFFLKSISERIEPLDQKAASAWLRRIVAILTDHFTVIAAFSDNEDSAAEVFETLNDRGIGLSTPDLLRNLVIRRAAANQRDDVVARWESVIAFETDTEIKAFLRHYWVSKHGDVKSQSLYREVKSVVENENINSIALSTELSDAAQLYRKIKTADAETEEASDILAAINTIGAGATILYPAILSILETLGSDDAVVGLTALLNVYTRDGIIGGIENSVLGERGDRSTIHASFPQQRELHRARESWGRPYAHPDTDRTWRIRSGLAGRSPAPSIDGGAQQRQAVVADVVAVREHDRRPEAAARDQLVGVGR